MINSCSPVHTTLPRSCHLSNTWWNIHASSWQLSAMMLMKAQTVAPARAIYSRLHSTAFGKLRNTLMTSDLFQAGCHQGDRNVQMESLGSNSVEEVEWGWRPGSKLLIHQGWWDFTMPHCGCNVFFLWGVVLIVVARWTTPLQKHKEATGISNIARTGWYFRSLEKLVHKKYSTKLDKT